MGKLPPLQIMIGKYIGYEMPSASDGNSALSTEDHAARLMGQLTGM